MLETLSIVPHLALPRLKLRYSSTCAFGGALTRVPRPPGTVLPSRGHIRTRARCDVEPQHVDASSSSRVEEEEGTGSEGAAEKPDEGGRVQRYLFAVEYIGTRYFGSQWLPGRPTVVGALQDAFQQFIGRPVSVVCSSRTDARVHAFSNVCHVDIERTSKRRPGEVLEPYDPAVVRRAVNHFLQKNNDDVLITDIRCVPMDFHARRMAVERIYIYCLLTGLGPLSLFERGLAWHVPQHLDVCAMQEACNVLVGSHDFSSFRSSGCQARSPVKTLDELCVSEVEPLRWSPSIMVRGLGSLNIPQSVNADKDVLGSADCLENSLINNLEFGQRRPCCLIIKARARSFLYNQVRLLVGVLKSVGMGELTANDVERILLMRTVTAISRMKAPACGLYLAHVKYNFS